MLYATQVRVYVGVNPKPFKAKVAMLAAEADIAVLQIIEKGLTSRWRSTGAAAADGAVAGGLSDASEDDEGDASMDSDDDADDASEEDSGASSSGSSSGGQSGQRSSGAGLVVAGSGGFWDQVTPIELAEECPGLQAPVQVGAYLRRVLRKVPDAAVVL